MLFVILMYTFIILHPGACNYSYGVVLFAIFNAYIFHRWCPTLIRLCSWSQCKVSIARTRVPNTNAHQAGASGMGLVSMDVYCCCSVTQCHILGHFWEEMCIEYCT